MGDRKKEKKHEQQEIRRTRGEKISIRIQREVKKGNMKVVFAGEESFFVGIFFTHDHNAYDDDDGYGDDMWASHDDAETIFSSDME